MRYLVAIILSQCMVGDAADCSVGGAGLCSCSELMHKHLIPSFDDCTQEAAIAACNSGECSHDSSNVIAPESLKAVEPFALPHKFHHDIGPFDMSWGFPSDDTIEIEFSLPSDYYVGIGLTDNAVGDAIAGWVDKDGKVHVGDYWDAGSREPDTDESKGCKDDVEPVSGHYKDGVTTVRFRRKLKTGDKGDCDAAIVKGPMSINYAWCDVDGCFDSQKGCKAYADGCLDMPHRLDASNHVTVDFSGNMLSDDFVV